LKRFLNFCKRQAIHHVISGEPALAGDADSKPEILQTRCAMGVRIDHTFNAFLFRQRPPPPVQIESLRRSIEFDPSPKWGQSLLSTLASKLET
jgi:hypothetical protein